MSIFTRHTENTSPEGASEVLDAVKQRYGFIPNLAAYVAESPNTLNTILKMSEAFDQSSFTAQEQQIVLLTVSALNGCSYCKTVHTALGKMADMEEATLNDVVALKPLKDPRLNSLRKFTQQLVENRGWLEEKDIQAFLEAGFDRGQVFEVVLGVALKTATNYSNHLANAEPNKEFLEMAKIAEVA